MRNKLAQALRSVFWVGLVVVFASLLFLCLFYQFSSIPILQTVLWLVFCALVQIAAYIGVTRFPCRLWWPEGFVLLSAFATLYAGAAGPAVLYGFSSEALLQIFQFTSLPPLYYAFIPFLLIAAFAALGYAFIGLLWLYCDIRRAVGNPLASDMPQDAPQGEAAGFAAVFLDDEDTAVIPVTENGTAEEAKAEDDSLPRDNDELSDEPDNSEPAPIVQAPEDQTNPADEALPLSTHSTAGDDTGEAVNSPIAPDASAPFPHNSLSLVGRVRGLWNHFFRRLSPAAQEDSAVPKTAPESQKASDAVISTDHGPAPADPAHPQTESTAVSADEDERTDMHLQA